MAYTVLAKSEGQMERGTMLPLCGVHGAALLFSSFEHFLVSSDQ